MVKNIDLDHLIRAANELEPLPASASRLASRQEWEACDLSELVEIIELDQALTMKLLRASNSAANYRGGEEITTVMEAVSRLGTAQVLTFALASHSRKYLQQALVGYGMKENDLWEHAVLTALVTETLQRFCNIKLPSEIFGAALLHDIGKLVLNRFLDPKILGYLERATTEGLQDPLAAEREILQITHAELGSIVAQNWRLPEIITRGIMYHHTPEEALDPFCDAIYLANEAANQVKAALTGKERPFHPDEDALARLGFDLHDLPKLIEVSSFKFDEVLIRYNLS